MEDSCVHVVYGIGSLVAGVVGVVVNAGVLYFMIEETCLRELSIAGLVIMSCVNDILVCIDFMSIFPQSLHFYWDLPVTYFQCFLGHVGE